MVVVHGGGPRIKRELSKQNIESKFVRGLRVTDEKIINIEAKRGRYFRLEIFSTQDELATEASFSQLKVLDVIER